MKKTNIKKLNVLQHVYDRLLSADKIQFVPNDEVEFNFMHHMFFIAQANLIDIAKVRQSASNLISSPLDEHEKRISQLLIDSGFSRDDLSKLESISEREKLKNEVQEMISKCILDVTLSIEKDKVVRVQ